MIGKDITCKIVSTYEGKLTRGKTYRVLKYNEINANVRVVADNGRTLWFPESNFDITGNPVPILLEWRFDDDPSDDDTNWVEVSIILSDGTNRWSILYTPERLLKLMQQPNIDPPGKHIHHMIIVRSFDYKDVDRMLRYLDNNDELIGASKLL